MKTKPVVKWAGGKRQLLDKIISLMPKKFNNYFEPFIGGGALLFELNPQTAVISDVNEELLSVYKCLADKKLMNLMIKELNKYEQHHSESYYLTIRSLDRESDFKLKPVWERAARTIYLNKTCFNGLYRVNSKGYFNVPSGKKEKANTYNLENLIAVNEFFSNNNITILNSDFYETCKSAQKNDFVYFDPPYDSYDEKKTFTSYSKFDFTREDQRRLADLYIELSNRGVKCMLSNHNTKYINSLYQNFNIFVVKAKRSINSKGNERGKVEEVLITNY